MTASLERLGVWTGNAVFDCTWHLQIEIDPEEALKARDRMVMDLARYGRLGVPGEGLGWGEVESTTIRRFHQILGEIIKEEGAGAALNT